MSPQQQELCMTPPPSGPGQRSGTHTDDVADHAHRGGPARLFKLPGCHPIRFSLSEILPQRIESVLTRPLRLQYRLSEADAGQRFVLRSSKEPRHGYLAGLRVQSQQPEIEQGVNVSAEEQPVAERVGARTPIRAEVRSLQRRLRLIAGDGTTARIGLYQLGPEFRLATPCNCPPDDTVSGVVVISRRRFGACFPLRLLLGGCNSLLQRGQAGRQGLPSCCFR